MENIKTLRDEILIRPIVKEKTESGLIIPEKSRTYLRGTVMSVSNEIDEPEISEGSTVFFPVGTGKSLDMGNEKFIVIRYEDILGVIKH